MTNLSRFMAVQPSSAYQSSEVSDNGEVFGTPETKSERSRYYDAESDGMHMLCVMTCCTSSAVLKDFYVCAHLQAVHSAQAPLK